MDEIESRLTFSEHHEEIGLWNLEDKQICGLILLVNKDEYEIGVFSEVKFAAVRVRVHSNKLIINAKFAIREVHVIFTWQKEERFLRFFGLLIKVNVSEEFSNKFIINSFPSSYL